MFTDGAFQSKRFSKNQSSSLLGKARFLLHVLLVTLQYMLCLGVGLAGRFYECIVAVLSWQKLVIASFTTFPLHLVRDIVRGSERYWVSRRPKAEASSLSRVTASGWTMG